ncbi:MAG: sugar transferase [Pyrinomonadaceae bacterium]|nr:sugar transferase [Pyrinomonadaceae bacterium]
MTSGSESLKPEPNRVPRWVMPLIKVAIAGVDASLAFLTFSMAFYLREGVSIFSPDGWWWSPGFLPYAAVLGFVIPIRVLMFMYQRVYRFSGAYSYVAEFIKVFKAVLTGSLFIIATTFLFRGGFAFREFSYSRAVFIFDFLIALVVFTLFHLGIRYVQALFRRRGINLVPTLIVGTNQEAKQTIEELEKQPDLGFRVVGVVETRPGTSEFAALERNGNKIQVVGNLEDLPDLIEPLQIQEVIITDSDIPSELLFETVMKSGRRSRVEFRLAPSVFNFMPQKTNVEQVGVLPMVRLFREPLTDAERFVKRFSDLVISFTSLLILSPLWFVLALAIRVDSKGPILFSQERVGMDGRKFLCLKFRTMHTNADDELHRKAYEENIRGEAPEESENGAVKVFGKVENDPRVTRFGKYLRRSSLDELPQLLNVVKGDMSIVGPRPPIPYEVDQYKVQQRKRLDMKPGITGLWQVSGRNRIPFEEMVKVDLYYIENWSLWLDLRIILLTLPAMFRGDETR